MKNWFRDNHGWLLVTLFLLAIVWFGSARAENLIEVGPSQVGASMTAGGMLTLTERRGVYDFTLGYITKQKFSACDRPSCTWHLKEQIFIGAERVFESPWSDRFRLSIGPYLFQRPDRVATARFRIGLSIEYQFTDRLGFRSRHFSTAGSGPEMTICRPEYGCLTNDWNTGQDSWARLVWYF